ncbi:MAG TPA: hypothetical protein VEL07_19040 [Planctomycetota bacterium]|nr:hypothetical protein [Planctomycetota bacterium]
MSRILVLVTALTLIGASALGAGHAMSARRVEAATAAIEAGRARVERESVGWNRGGSLANAAARVEAERTLALLRELYGQERRLWAYYDATVKGAWTREKLAAERAELELSATRHAHELERIEREAARLRPDPALPAIDFTAGPEKP